MGMGRPHVIVIPYPAQGHVMPLMELSHNLVDRGFQITFVNIESIHKKVVAALSNNGDQYQDFIHLVPIPDVVEIEPTDGQLSKDIKLIESMEKELPGHLEELIEKIDDKIACVITDGFVGWALEVAERLSIPRAVMFPAAALLLALNLHIPKLIEDGIITAAQGDVVKHQMVQLSPTMPAMNTTHFWWLNIPRPDVQKVYFNATVQNNRGIKLADHLICNSFYELEPLVFNLLPNLKPIGPLYGSSRLAQFWPEDLTCLRWLDQQPERSVMYVAFGSITVMNKQQFDEVALGLELSGRSFLWVVRSDLIDKADGAYPEGFAARVGTRGQMVSWAPQKEVLAHPSVGGFLTHCGWNSTMEGISNGVPLLCWPYFSDQILNKSYICNAWKNGLGLSPDANGFISREEIKTKVSGLLGDEEIKAAALNLKETAVKNVDVGGASSKNFDNFVQAIK